MSLRSALTVAAVILLAIWITSNPAQAGNDIHSMWTSAITFFQHLAGAHS